jgi:hypothetical protein
MRSIQNDVTEFRKQLAAGSIQNAYRALLSYMSGLRARFAEKYGDSAVSGLYQGYLDMTYFSIAPPLLKSRDLKIAVVFNYDAFGFEAWLAARNRKIQKQYWELLRDNQWDGCRVVAPAAGVDSIIECDIASGFDLSKPEVLTTRIELAVDSFNATIEMFLSEGRCC